MKINIFKKIISSFRKLLFILIIPISIFSCSSVALKKVDSKILDSKNNEINNFLKKIDLGAYMKTLNNDINVFHKTYDKMESAEIKNSELVKKIILKKSPHQGEFYFQDVEKLKLLLEKTNQIIYEEINQEKNQRMLFLNIFKKETDFIFELRKNTFPNEKEKNDFENFVNEIINIIKNSKGDQNQYFRYLSSPYPFDPFVRNDSFISKKRLDVGVTEKEEDDKTFSRISSDYLKDLDLFWNNDDYQKFVEKYKQINDINSIYNENKWDKLTNKEGESKARFGKEKYKILFEPIFNINENKLKIAFYFHNEGKGIVESGLFNNWAINNSKNIYTEMINVDNAIKIGNTNDYKNIPEAKKIIKNFIIDNGFDLFSLISGRKSKRKLLDTKNIFEGVLGTLYPNLQGLLSNFINFIDYGIEEADEKLKNDPFGKVNTKMTSDKKIEKAYNLLKNNPKVDIDWMIEKMKACDFFQMKEEKELKEDFVLANLTKAKTDKIENIFITMLFFVLIQDAVI